jgi:hypothetical protein
MGLPILQTDPPRQLAARESFEVRRLALGRPERRDGQRWPPRAAAKGTIFPVSRAGRPLGRTLRASEGRRTALPLERYRPPK